MIWSIAAFIEDLHSIACPADALQGFAWTGGLAQPFSLILLPRVRCPCLSGFWRDRAGIFIVMITGLPRPWRGTRQVGYAELSWEGTELGCGAAASQPH